MNENILKLLKSSLFEDNYIGLKLLDNLLEKEIKAFLDKNFETGEASYTWIYRRKESIDIPYPFESNYIEGKYYYSLAQDNIMIDDSIMYEWADNMFKEDKDIYKIVETWK